VARPLPAAVTNLPRTEAATAQAVDNIQRQLQRIQARNRKPDAEAAMALPTCNAS
jgi:hypothetical protein